MTEVKEPPCLVLGGGILGCAAAFYLRERGLQGQIIVIDAEELAAGASGAAAGLLMAEDASSSPAFRSFTKHSVALHQGLASDSRFVDCGYRKITLAAFQTAQGRRDAAGTKKALPGWASLRAAERAKLTVQSAPVATFQCRPKLLAHALFTAAKAEFLRARVVALARDAEHRITAAIVLTHSAGLARVPCSRVVSCLGPFSPQLSQWLPALDARLVARLQDLRVSKAQGLLLDTSSLGAALPAQACWLPARGRDDKVEVYPRQGHELHVHSLYTPLALPDLVGLTRSVTLDAGAEAALRADLLNVTEHAQHSALPALQHCAGLLAYFLGPVGRELLLGQLHPYRNAWLACGAGPWGVTSSLACGESLAQLVMEGTVSRVATPFCVRPAGQGPGVLGRLTKAGGRKRSRSSDSAASKASAVERKDSSEPAAKKRAVGSHRHPVAAVSPATEQKAAAAVGSAGSAAAASAAALAQPEPVTIQHRTARFLQLTGASGRPSEQLLGTLRGIAEGSHSDATFAVKLQQDAFVCHALGFVEHAAASSDGGWTFAALSLGRAELRTAVDVLAAAAAEKQGAGAGAGAGAASGDMGAAAAAAALSKEGVQKALA